MNKLLEENKQKAIPKSAKLLTRAVDKFVDSFVPALGKSSAYLVVGSISGILFKLGIEDAFIEKMLSALKHMH